MLPSIDGLARMDDATLAQFRERLGAAGYDGDLVSAAENVAPVLLDALRLPLVRWWLGRRPGNGSTLALLFCYRTAVAAASVRAALGDELTGRLFEAGVLETNDEGLVSSRFLLIPLEGQWFLSDYLDVRDEAVMGPGMTTLLLHRLIASSDAKTVLDLGCGAASLAISAARRGARAIAADISARAVAIASFNARLGGVAIECRQGDCTAPVADVAFDLIVSQPPYVPLAAGDAGVTYLHGGSYGDELAIRFTAECARVLAPGGVALLHFDSAVRTGAPLANRLREATAGTAVDSIALVDRAANPDQQSIAYAASTNRYIDAPYAEAVVAHREHLESLGVIEFSRVLVVLRRPPSGEELGGRYRLVMPTTKLSRMSSDSLPRLFTALELALVDDAGLLRSHVAAPAGSVFVDERDAPDAKEPLRLSLKVAEGSLTDDREISDRAWVLFGLLGSGLSVGETLTRFATMGDEPEAAVRSEVIGFVREGLARGLLEPRPPNAG